jgi:hypothetical protein
VKIFLSLFFIALLSCSTRQVLLNSNALSEHQTVTIETCAGEKRTGVVFHADSAAVLIRDSSGQKTEILMSDIVKVKGPFPVLDNNGILVTESEIDSAITNTNLTVYAIVGGAISSGVSFLVSSLVNNEILGHSNSVPVYVGTISGAAVGTILFAHSGAVKDREKAIDNILMSRSKAEFMLSLPDQEKDVLLKEKIQQLIQERKQAEKEIRELEKELKDSEPQQRDKTE